MAFLGGNRMPPDLSPPYLFGIAIALIGGLWLSTVAFSSKATEGEPPGLLKSFLLFFYSCFIKPHNGDAKGTQQDALESFYKKQAGAYDATRRILLRGREDLLALVAAQLQSKADTERRKRRIWVDVGHYHLLRSLDVIEEINMFAGGRRHRVQH